MHAEQNLERHETIHGLRLSVDALGDEMFGSAHSNLGMGVSNGYDNGNHGYQLTLTATRDSTFFVFDADIFNCLPWPLCLQVFF